MSAVKSAGIWAHGLGSAAISGVSTAIAAALVAPETFNINDGLNQLLQLGLVGGIIGAVNYLKQSPLPPIDKGNDL